MHGADERPTVRGCKVDSTLERLRTIWAEVLRGQCAADGDCFLDLGGDSIAATLCVNRIQEIFDVEIGMSRLLSEPLTLAALADQVDALIADPAVTMASAHDANGRLRNHVGWPRRS